MPAKSTQAVSSSITVVVDHFSDAVLMNPIVGQQSREPWLQEWHTKNLGRLPGLKFMRTLWVCHISGWALPLHGHQAPHDSPSALRRPTGSSGSPPQNSTRSQPSSAGPSTPSRSLSARRPKSWLPSPPRWLYWRLRITRTRRPLSKLGFPVETIPPDFGLAIVSCASTR